MCVAPLMQTYTGRPWKGGQGQQSAAEGFTPTYSPFVKRVLKNGLKSPLGAWAVIGLYGTPVCGLLVATSPDGHAAAAVLPHWVSTSILLPFCITGRVIAFVAELAIIHNWMRLVVTIAIDQPTASLERCEISTPSRNPTFMWSCHNLSLFLTISSCPRY
ncbi:hypothetical protein FOZ63_004128 [Perkinsus olseni]|uniref:Uncharacterized protein n=1 Tax=Perkinsus olseni TaxID=32597 RepID=A0A7J6RD17_PEROL|nr:hypothetical protein FOZ63_004128 [Perkinsus olseni]